MPRPSVEEIARVEHHLRRFSNPLESPERMMLERLNAGQWTAFDQRFFEHENLEADLMESGTEWEEAHFHVLALQGITYGPGYEAYLYHPDVITDPEARLWFSRKARELSSKLASAKDD